jgi:hypothetical protein
VPRTTVYCNRPTFGATIDRLLLRSQEMNPIHKLYNCSRDDAVSLFWERISKELKSHYESTHSDPITEYAFIFGAPFDDTVFMFSPGRASPAEQYEVEVELTAPAELTIDFYRHFPERRHAVSSG